MEMNALVSSYVECLQYSIIRKLGGSDQEIIMAQKLTEQHVSILPKSVIFSC